ncbi:MAG: hypothetical protein ACR2IV_00330 [Bryobacteraceae bacterium]
MLLEASTEPQIEVKPEIRAHRGWRAVFSFPVVLALLLVVLTVITVRSRFNDPDLWYHLKIGEIMWNTHLIPRVDVFSFTAYGHPWVAQEWLSQLTLYGIYKFGGYMGLMLWLCTLPSLLIVAEFVLCAFYSGNVKVAFLGGLITWLFATVGFALRPHLVGYLLLVCELLILYVGRSRDARWFLGLPFLFAFWINSHGSFFFGSVVLAVVLFCSFLEVHWGLVVSRRWEKRSRNMLAVASVLSLAALSINPLGLKLILSPIEVMGKLPVNLSQVQEWLPPHFDTGRGFGLLAVTGLILLVPLLRRAELSVEELLLTALGFGFAVLHERMVFIFGILAAPILCRVLADLWDRYEPDREQPLLNAVFIVVSILAMVWAFPSGRQLQKQVEDGSPVKALDYIKRVGLSGPMVNEYVYGGYLIWAAPQYKVFVDGRGDIFELTGVLSEYGDWIMVHTDPKVLLDKYHINFCLLSRDAPVTHVLPLLSGWKLVYSDKMSNVFVRQM